MQSGPLPIDLRADLGIGQRQPTFTARLDVKPARRRHIIVEGTPYKFSSTNTLSRTITFRGTQYSLNEAVASTADVDYVLGGYQFDVLSRKQGHLVHTAVSPFRFMAIEAGYMVMDAGIHSKSGKRGVAPHSSGQVFSVQFRDR